MTGKNRSHYCKSVDKTIYTDICRIFGPEFSYSQKNSIIRSLMDCLTKHSSRYNENLLTMCFDLQVGGSVGGDCLKGEGVTRCTAPDTDGMAFVTVIIPTPIVMLERMPFVYWLLNTTKAMSHKYCSYAKRAKLPFDGDQFMIDVEEACKSFLQDLELEDVPELNAANAEKHKPIYDAKRYVAILVNFNGDLFSKYRRSGHILVLNEDLLMFCNQPVSPSVEAVRFFIEVDGGLKGISTDPLEDKVAYCKIEHGRGLVKIHLSKQTVIGSVETYKYVLITLLKQGVDRYESYLGDRNMTVSPSFRNGVEKAIEEYFTYDSTKFPITNDEAHFYHRD